MQRLKMAQARAQRRATLWHAARLQYHDNNEFRALWHVIAAAVEKQLEIEFPELVR